MIVNAREGIDLGADRVTESGATETETDPTLATDAATMPETIGVDIDREATIEGGKMSDLTIGENESQVTSDHARETDDGDEVHGASRPTSDRREGGETEDTIVTLQMQPWPHLASIWVGVQGTYYWRVLAASGSINTA